MSQVIAVVSGKGGTGKTSFTTLTGMALAQLGKKTLLLDCDIGLRNLDLYLGVSDRALMDFTDVIAGRTTLAQAVVRHPLYPNLYLLTAPVSFGVRLPSKHEMQRLIDEIRRHFDFCLIDAAGLPLLGVIPEDENVPAVLGRGLSQRLKYRSGALCACENIARRLCGDRVRLMRL